MKQTILMDDPIRFEKRLQTRTQLSLTIVLVTLGLNVALTLLRTDTNHTWLLIINIVADILCGLFLLPFITLRILPQRRLLKLSRRDKELLSATAIELSQCAQRYMDMDCLTVTTENRTLFLPADTLSLEKDAAYRFYIVQNIIVEAEQ